MIAILLNTLSDCPAIVCPLPVDPDPLVLLGFTIFGDGGIDKDKMFQQGKVATQETITQH